MFEEFLRKSYRNSCRNIVGSPTRETIWLWNSSRIWLSRSLEHFFLAVGQSNFGKVHIFWEGHKILRNLLLTFDWYYIGQKEVKILQNFVFKYCNPTSVARWGIAVQFSWEHYTILQKHIKWLKWLWEIFPRFVLCCKSRRGKSLFKVEFIINLVFHRTIFMLSISDTIQTWKLFRKKNCCNFIQVSYTLNLR